MRRTKICTHFSVSTLTASLEITNTFCQVRCNMNLFFADLKLIPEPPGRNYAIIREYGEGDTFSSDDTKPVKRSTFSRIRKSTFLKSQKTSSAANTTLVGLEETNVSTGRIDRAQMKKGALDVTLRMEVNQKDPSGDTKPYRLIIPTLNYERATVGNDSHSDDHGGWI